MFVLRFVWSCLFACRCYCCLLGLWKAEHHCTQLWLFLTFKQSWSRGSPGTNSSAHCSGRRPDLNFRHYNLRFTTSTPALQMQKGGSSGLQTSVHICIHTQTLAYRRKVKLANFFKCSSNKRCNNLQTTCACNTASRNQACWYEDPIAPFTSNLHYNAV